jgi:hypothetical protein
LQQEVDPVVNADFALLPRCIRGEEMRAKVHHPPTQLRPRLPSESMASWTNVANRECSRWHRRRRFPRSCGSRPSASASNSFCRRARL